MDPALPNMYKSIRVGDFDCYFEPASGCRSLKAKQFSAWAPPKSSGRTNRCAIGSWCSNMNAFSRTAPGPVGTAQVEVSLSLSLSLVFPPLDCFSESRVACGEEEVYQGIWVLEWSVGEAPRLAARARSAAMFVPEHFCDMDVTWAVDLQGAFWLRAAAVDHLMRVRRL
eukprot:41784-Prorocentrum_minimum.AAC.2